MSLARDTNNRKLSNKTW